MNFWKLHPRHFWSSESGLTALLIFLIAYLVIQNSLGELSFGRMLGRVFFSLIILAGVMTISKQRWLHGLALVLAVASLTLTWVEELRPTVLWSTLNAGSAFLYLGLLLALVVTQVFRQGPVTGHRIRGAIVVYLLLGALWALMYQVSALTVPGAFRIPAGLAGAEPQELQQQLLYFSFITLTTTGYGDVTPAHPAVRTLSMLEALTGQLYLSITLARMVSLAVMHQKENLNDLTQKRRGRPHDTEP